MESSCRARKAAPPNCCTIRAANCAALAEELLRSGICSFLFTHPINVGELDLLAHEISQVPRSASPGDTASRKLWDNWIKNRGVVGIRINIPTERRDSLLLASLMSAVLAYDNAAQHSSYSRAVPDDAGGELRANRGHVARVGKIGAAQSIRKCTFDGRRCAAFSFRCVRKRTVLHLPDRVRSLARKTARRRNTGALSGAADR